MHESELEGKYNELLKEAIESGQPQKVIAFASKMLRTLRPCWLLETTLAAFCLALDGSCGSFA